MNMACVIIISHVFKALDTILLKVLFKYRPLLKQRIFFLTIEMPTPLKSHDILVPESSLLPN